MQHFTCWGDLIGHQKEQSSKQSGNPSNLIGARYISFFVFTAVTNDEAAEMMSVSTLRALMDVGDAY